VTTELLDPPMAEEKPKTPSVKLPVDVIESARIVAAYRNATMADVLGEILRPILARMEQEEIAKRTRAEKPAPHPKKKVKVDDENSRRETPPLSDSLTSTPSRTRPTASTSDPSSHRRVASQGTPG
jgi:hypothetical protein